MAQHQDSTTVPNETMCKLFIILNKLEIYQHSNAANALVAKMVMRLAFVLYLYDSTFRAFHVQINPYIA